MKPVGPTYAASAFPPDSGEAAPEEGVIFIHGGFLYFQSGNLSLNIPLTYLQVELGEGETLELRFSHNSTKGWILCTSDESIFEHPEMKRAANVRAQLGRMFGRQELKRRLIVTGGILVACVLLAWLGSLAVGAMVRSLVARTPVKYEEELGAEAMKEVRDSYDLLEDSNRVARLEALAKPLVQVAMPGQTAVRFHIVDENIPNAFAVPGGQVVVTTGLLDMCETPDELLGVVAHELAHVTRRHAIRSKISAAGPILIFVVFARQGGGMGNLLAGGSALLVNQSFSQEYEMEADDTGWDYLVAANVNPHAMIDAFHRLETYERNLSFQNDIPAAFRSHPATLKRIARLEKKWKRLPVKSGFIELGSARL